MGGELEGIVGKGGQKVGSGEVGRGTGGNRHNRGYGCRLLGECG